MPINKNSDLIQTQKRSYTPKDWVIIPPDMPAEYKDYGYRTVSCFQQKASAVGHSTRALIDAVIQKSTYLVQSFEAALVFCDMRKNIRRKPWNAAVRSPFWLGNAAIPISVTQS